MVTSGEKGSAREIDDVDQSFHGPLDLSAV